MLYNNGSYQPQLKLITVKDSTYIKEVDFTYDKLIKDPEVELNYDVQILDAQNNKYDVIFTLNGKETSVIGKGLSQTTNTQPYNTLHSISSSKIAPNSNNNLNFKLLNFGYDINGTKAEYHLIRGFGNPISDDFSKTLSLSDNLWVVIGNPIKQYTRVIGDKRYELSNHLGNVLSVISNHKAISNDDGIIENQIRFELNTDIAPWFAHNLTDAIELTKGEGLAVTTINNLNGIGATYYLEANSDYEILFTVANKMKAPLEFGISYNSKKVMAEMLKPKICIRRL